MRIKNTVLNCHSVPLVNQSLEGALIVPRFYHNVVVRARDGGKNEKASI